MADNPLLKQLHDIHLPHAIGYWPLAPGWWILMLLCVPSLLMGIYYTKRFLKAYRLKKIYLMELKTIKYNYQQHQDARVTLEKLAELLKSFALLIYPREMVASLHGRAWYDFLKQSTPGLDVSPMYALLTESLYQKQFSKDISKAFFFVEVWIKKQRLSCMT